MFVFILWVLPNIVFYTFANHNLNYLMLLLVPYALISLFTYEKKFFDLKKFKIGKLIILPLSFIILFVVIVHYLTVTGGKIVINFSEVYDLRREFEEYSSGGIFGYLNSWAFKLFSLLILCWAIYKKKFIYILISSFIILFLFILSGHKSALVGIVIVPFFYLLYKFKNTTNIILIFFIFILIFSIFLGWVFDSIFPESIIIRRMFMVPSFLNFTYLDFFSNNSMVYWSNSIFSSLYTYPYDKPLPYVIGEYLGYPHMGANTGFIASGFAHAKILGIFIYTFIAIIIMNLINVLAKTNSKYFVMSIIIMPLVSMFTSSDLPTSLLTHGLIISISILWLYNEKRIKFKLGKYKYEI
jgi:hypothetical protein